MSIRKSQSTDQIATPSFTETQNSFTTSSVSDSGSSEAPMPFQRYGGKFNMVKNVFEIDEAYDV